MKNTLTFLLVLSCLFFSSCSRPQKVNNSFTLQGEIIGQETGRIFLSYGFGLTFHKDTAKIENGKFSFKGVINEPTRAVIIGVDENRGDIYLEPGVINVTLIKDKFKDIKVSGSKSQEELESLNNAFEKNTNHDSIILSFVTKSPKSYLTPYYLQYLSSNQIISIDSLRSIYEGLDMSIQNSRYGRYTLGLIRKHDNLLEGSTPSDFKAVDLNDQTLSLSQFKGKNVVLLDFWASTCPPCRKQIPHFKQIYKKYHSKGLEIIAITCADKNRDSWMSAIKEDSTTMWHQVASYFLTGETINEDICLDYPIFGVPKTILINKDGKVAGSWVFYSEENENSIDKKLAEVIKN